MSSAILLLCPFISHLPSTAIFSRHPHKDQSRKTSNFSKSMKCGWEATAISTGGGCYLRLFAVFNG